MDEDGPDSVESEVSDVEEVVPSQLSIFNIFRNSFANRDGNMSDVDSSGDSEGTSVEIPPDPDEETRTLPCEHQYLGELEQVRGRVIMDDGSIQKIPLLFPASQVTLVPGQPFPLLETEETAINILKYSVEGDHIFGIIPLSFWNHTHSLSNMIGTTAEIIAYGQSNNGYKVKAIGRQRFKVIRDVSELIKSHEWKACRVLPIYPKKEPFLFWTCISKSSFTPESAQEHSSKCDSYITFAYIKILPEIILQPVLDGVQLPSLNKFRSSSQRFKCLRREACQTRWPVWIYRNYDEKYLVENVKKKLTQYFSVSKNIIYSDDATTLSFQLLKNVPISQKFVLEAMKLNSPIQRLRWFMHKLNSQTGKLKCVTCQTTIGCCADIFAMSAEGPHGTYVNSVGYVHELITLKKVKNIFASSGPETEYSWFPGYAWSVLSCKDCHNHIGWKFTSCKKDLMPNEFWGIKNSSIEVKYEKNADEEKITIPMRIMPRYYRFHVPRLN